VRINRSFQVDIGNLLCFMAIIIYGLFGWGPDLVFARELGLSSRANFTALIFLVICVFCIYILRVLSQKWQINLVIEVQDIQAALMVVLIYILFNFEKISLILSGDELFHSASAVAISKSVIPGIAESLPAFFLSSDARLLLSLIQLSVVIALFVLYKALERFKSGLFAVLVFLLLFASNLLFIGYGYKYPSGYIIPQFLGSPLFISDSFFRILQVLALSLVLVFVTRSVRKKHGLTAQVLLISIFLSLPVVSLGVVVIDQAVYFGILAGAALFLQVRISNNSLSAPHIWKASIFLSFLIMARSSALVLLITLVFIFLSSKIQKEYLVNAYPLIAIVPILIGSGLDLIRGVIAPATTNDGIAFAQSTNPTIALFQSLFSEFDYISLVSLFVCFLSLLLIRSTRKITFLYLTLVFTIFAFQIPVAVLGHNKYAFEGMIPIILFALLIFTASEFFALVRKRTLILFGILVFMSLTLASSLTDFRTLDQDLDEWNQVPGLIHYPLERTDLSKFLIDNNLQKVCVNAGVTYGHFSEISEGISLKSLEELENRSLASPQTLDWGRGISSNLNLDAYRCLIIDNYLAKSKLRSLLELQGFVNVYQATGSIFTTRTEVWVKSS
jgi:hypothetical protein